MPCARLPQVSLRKVMCARRAVHVRGPTEDEVHVCPAPRRPVPSGARWRARGRGDSTSCALGGGIATERASGLAGHGPGDAAQPGPSVSRACRWSA